MDLSRMISVLQSIQSNGFGFIGEACTHQDFLTLQSRRLVQEKVSTHAGWREIVLTEKAKNVLEQIEYLLK